MVPIVHFLNALSLTESAICRRIEAKPFVGVQMFYQSSKTKNQVLVSKFFQYLETKEAQSKLQEQR